MTLFILFLFLTAKYLDAAEVKHFESKGDCYELTEKYLRTKNIPFVISSSLKGKECNWFFRGNVEFDFQTWCKKEGLSCGGNPYFVGYDSLYSLDGVRVPASVAYAEKRAKKEADSTAQSLQRREDSIASYIPPPLPKRKIFLEYLELSKTTAEKLGFSYSDYVGSARFFDYSDLFSVSLQALGLGDTSFIYRNYSAVYDSVLSVFWGGQKQIKTSSIITSDGFVTENLEFQEVGLKFDVENEQFKYEHSTDYENKINGAGVLVVGVNNIFGSYQSYFLEDRKIPFFSSIPLLGYLFKHTQKVNEWRFIFIRVKLEVL